MRRNADLLRLAAAHVVFIKRKKVFQEHVKVKHINSVIYISAGRGTSEAIPAVQGYVQGSFAGSRQKYRIYTGCSVAFS